MTHQIVIVGDRKIDSKSAAKEHYRKVRMDYQIATHIFVLYAIR